MNPLKRLRQAIDHQLTFFTETDTEDAARRIREGIYFRGPNVWILACSVVIASVGLNINSTAAIIGAMLISPLMGPIIGTGLAVGINDTDLLKSSLHNLGVMVFVSLLFSTLYFLLTPLYLMNPTELEARTQPTVYDVLIAFFGGLAGILDYCRKERGTVISGVAIATALMPPLCTAGYGIANLSAQHFFGAFYLFIINAFFITLSTFLMVRYTRFRPVEPPHAAHRRRRKNRFTLIVALITLPSLFSAGELVVRNNYERSIRAFVEQHRLIGKNYIYNYKINGRTVTFDLVGEPMDEDDRAHFMECAKAFHLNEERIVLNPRYVWGADEGAKRKAPALPEGADFYALQMQVERLSAKLDSLLSE